MARGLLSAIERTNISLEVQNSIVPAAYNLARFKVSANLPALQVNMSDAKYKSLMRLIDVCIPKLGDDTPSTLAPPPLPKQASSGFQLPSVFSQVNTEYHVEEDDNEGENEGEGDPSNADEDLFFEASDGSMQVPLFR